MSGTALHNAIVATINAFTQANIPDLDVSDGPNWNPGVLTLEVAWAGEDRDAVEITRSANNASLSGGVERGSIWCLMSNHQGRGTVAEARKRLIDTLTSLIEALEADTTLDGTVAAAQIGDLRYAPQRSEGNALATVAFPVEFTAFP